MAGYRPKNLDELNNMFDKTMAAEKAIKKGTSLLEKGESTTVTPELPEDIEQITDQVKQSMGLTEEINDFIAKFSPEVSEEKTEDNRPKPQMTVITPEQPKPTYELDSQEEENTPAAESEGTKADRDNLMDEYVRIMNDEDDDYPQKKLSRKEKKKLKMKEKKAAGKAGQSDSSYGSEDEQNVPFDSAADDEFTPPDYVSPVSDNEADPDTTVTADNSENDFDFPENYTPDWMKEEEEEESDKAGEKRRKSSSHAALKGLLSIVLVLIVLVGAVATVFKTFIPVNTGKAARDTFYFFTAYKDYPALDISKGDLVITEKSYAEDGDVFAYIDYSERAFTFGKRSDSTINDDGIVLLVTEKDGNRTLVSRDDCRGVLYTTYSDIGGIISILTDNFIIVIALAAVLSLVIILVLALALRSKTDEDDDYDEDRSSEEESDEDSEVEEVDLFSTVE